MKGQTGVKGSLWTVVLLSLGIHVLGPDIIGLCQGSLVKGDHCSVSRIHYGSMFLVMGFFVYKRMFLGKGTLFLVLRTTATVLLNENAVL